MKSPQNPDGRFNRCPACGKALKIKATTPPADATCAACGHAIWFPPLPGIEGFDFIEPRAATCDLEADSKEEAIGKLVEALARTGHVPEASTPDVTDAFIRREQLGSTAIGHGFAVPHIKHPAIKDLVGTIGYCPRGVDFHGLDGELVHTVILIISPPNQPGDHLRALERIARYLRSA